MTQPTIPEGETQNDYNYEYQTFGDRWNPIYYLDCYTTTQFKEKYPKARYRVAKTKLSEITICAINHFRMSGVISNLETHVSDFIAGAEWQKAQAGGEWISVETALPENKTEVNVLLGNSTVKIATFIINNCHKSFYCGQSTNMSYGNVTHWMPLPEPLTHQ